MKKFKVVIPEKRVEVVSVVYEIEAKNEEEVKALLSQYDFLDKAEYVETKESKWGFEVEEVYDSQAEITEITND